MTGQLSSVTTRRLVEGFYAEIWNAGDLEAAEQILAPSLSFRGTLGTTAESREGFLDYVRNVRSIFPNWHCRLDDLVAEPERAAARLTFSGLQARPVLGRRPIGKPLSYAGAGFFRIAETEEGPRIVEAWVLGDLAALEAQLDGREHNRAVLS